MKKPQDPSREECFQIKYPVYLGRLGAVHPPTTISALTAFRSMEINQIPCRWIMHLKEDTSEPGQIW